MNTENEGYITLSTLTDYIQLRHSIGYEYDLRRDGPTITFIRILIRRIDSIIGWPHRFVLKYFLQRYLIDNQRRGINSVTIRNLYMEELFVIDIWTNVWPFLHLFGLYPVIFYSCYYLYNTCHITIEHYILISLILAAAYLISLYRAVDIICTLLRLHLSEKYYPYSNQRAVIGTFCQFIDITIFFANTYLLLHSLIGRNTFNTPHIFFINMVQPIYYSFVTITTLGYGDIYPISWPVQLTVIAQLLIGLLIIVIIFQRVLSMQKEPNLQHLKQHFPPNQKTEGEVSNQYDIFYTKFLDRFRHGEDFLRQCFQRYIEIFRNQNPVLDLCCGRGEFLGVMQSSGIEAYGIENNQFLFEKCTKKGLNVKNKDWKEHLHSLEDGSLGGLFSSQFIEHLQYQDLLWLVDVASRKLKPGGVLVLETLCPNLNTILGKFFVDFSHKSPINPEALSFLVANYGFKSTEILYYNYPEPQNMLQKLIGEFADGDMAVVINDNFQKIQKLLFGPHYFAVIGRK